MSSNGEVGNDKPLKRAEEADRLLTEIKNLIVPFIDNADQDFATQASTGHGLNTLPPFPNPTSPTTAEPQQPPVSGPRTTLHEHHPPKTLSNLLDFHLPPHSPSPALSQPSPLNTLLTKLLTYSTNTWHQGFLSKLYSTPTPIGLAADTLLSALNTNLHVYNVSPALTIIEKETARALAIDIFGLGTVPKPTDKPTKRNYAGGVSMPGGSAANHTSLIIARNTLFPSTKLHGLASLPNPRLKIFTSKHGHYSVEKAAQMLGLGSTSGVIPVAVDAQGRMKVAALEAAVRKCRADGDVPFYVNATAGTTVLGSFDPLDAIADVCARERIWMHVDASWGGGVAFSSAESKTGKRTKLKGVERADTVSFCPHKMLNVPVTCSFLLGRDLRVFWRGMSLPAGYLFHDDDDEKKDETEMDQGDDAKGGDEMSEEEPKEVWDLADLTPQCGRRGDSLKLALAWIYHGTEGFTTGVDQAFEVAAYMAEELEKRATFSLISENPPPCLQVCFYYNERDDAQRNTSMTAYLSRSLVPKGFMIDYAPGEKGKFLRVVVNTHTRKETVDALLTAIEEVGDKFRG